MKTRYGAVPRHYRYFSFSNYLLRSNLLPDGYGSAFRSKYQNHCYRYYCQYY